MPKIRWGSPEELLFNLLLEKYLDTKDDQWLVKAQGIQNLPKKLYVTTRLARYIK